MAFAKVKIIKQLAEKMDVPYSQALYMYDSFIQVIKENINKGDVVLTGFGRFTKRQRGASRMYQRFQKKIINVAPVNNVRFKAAVSLKNLVNQK